MNTCNVIVLCSIVIILVNENTQKEILERIEEKFKGTLGIVSYSGDFKL